MMVVRMAQDGAKTDRRGRRKKSSKWWRSGMQAGSDGKCRLGRMSQQMSRQVDDEKTLG